MQDMLNTVRGTAAPGWGTAGIPVIG